MESKQLFIIHALFYFGKYRLVKCMEVFFCERKEVNVMCNLSQGIRDDEDEKIILNMHKKGYTFEQIADIVEKSVVEVEAVIQKREPALV